MQNITKFIRQKKAMQSAGKEGMDIRYQEGQMQKGLQKDEARVSSLQK